MPSECKQNASRASGMPSECKPTWRSDARPSIASVASAAGHSHDAAAPFGALGTAAAAAIDVGLGHFVDGRTSTANRWTTHTYLSDDLIVVVVRPTRPIECVTNEFGVQSNQPKRTILTSVGTSFRLTVAATIEFDPRQPIASVASFVVVGIVGCGRRSRRTRSTSVVASPIAAHDATAAATTDFGRLDSI